MSKQRTELTRAEWALMDALWQAGQATATDLQRMLEESQGWAYSTVKTMLDRLVDLGFVKARRVGNVYEYSPRTKRPTMVGRVIDDVTERFFDGSVTPFIQCLLQRGKMSAEEAAQLRQVLDDYANNDGSR